MSNIKSFSRSVRQELNRISMQIKQLDFKIIRLRGFLKKRLRQEVQELKRMKDAILHKLSKLTKETRLHLPTMQEIRNDIEMLNNSCRQFKIQHF
jgi:hypothetical protein